ncbi:MAG: protein-L-isoaspartate(D-aspartate) O-methyltransferase [Victivallaceae bacterium]|nr:protein-L-isoaspartate(D-aspartate) O-methyltransferase [Victivallaceae bacterium]
MIKIFNDDFAENRDVMIITQLKSRGIMDEAVLQAMAQVPRENFVLRGDMNRAYDDIPLPIICGQTISQPYIVALMSELLELPEQEKLKILEIGSGSGYQAAVLTAMGHQVYSVEIIAEVAEFARNNLNRAGYGKNVRIKAGDGCCGFPEHAPYDGILVTAASPLIPKDLLEQLNTDATLVIPCGNRFIQQLQQVRKLNNGKFAIKQNIGCRFVPLTGKDGFK